MYPRLTANCLVKITFASHILCLSLSLSVKFLRFKVIFLLMSYLIKKRLTPRQTWKVYTNAYSCIWKKERSSCLPLFLRSSSRFFLLWCNQVGLYALTWAPTKYFVFLKTRTLTWGGSYMQLRQKAKCNNPSLVTYWICMIQQLINWGSSYMKQRRKA